MIRTAFRPAMRYACARPFRSHGNNDMADTLSAHPDDPHYVHRSGWLRAAVLGANDGIVSVSSLILGVAAATPAMLPRIAMSCATGH
jgi:VIT1/CCC1 family predicted Fe2+/Mn2+ transporter